MMISDLFDAVTIRKDFCSGGRIRTCDLWVMGPTSYLCSTPQYIFIIKTPSGHSPKPQPIQIDSII
jgi:hypothetical protein